MFNARYRVWFRHTLISFQICYMLISNHVFTNNLYLSMMFISDLVSDFFVHF